MMQVHRFRDCAGGATGTGPTVYLTASEARRAAKALLRIARSIDTERFVDAPSLTVGDISTYREYPHGMTGRGQWLHDKRERALARPKPQA